MSAQATIEQQFTTLLQEGEAVKGTTKTSGGASRNVISIPVAYVDGERARVWAMNALTLVRSVFGTDSDYYSEIQKSLPNCGLYGHFEVILSCVKSALESLRNGYLFETKALMYADVAVDYLEQAKQLMDAGYKDAAAVIGGSVLERHLRGMCDARGISTVKANGKPMSMNDLNDELARANVYNLLKKKQITAWADIRNNSAHGDYAKYNAADVDTMLRDVTSFCADYT